MKKAFPLLVFIFIILLCFGGTLWSQIQEDQGATNPLSTDNSTMCISVYNWETNEWTDCQ
jgi:hypothetical protein